MAEQLEVRSDGGNYTIHIDAGNWDDLVQRVIDDLQPTAVAVASDSNVGPLYADRVAAALSDSNIKTINLRCDAGETAKCVDQLQGWWQALATAKVDRKTVIIAIGGGVIGDLAGFVAASHLRGLRFVQVPTSLLAQVDSSVGGKVGINLPQGKNLVGAFWQPELVWIDTSVLSTLSDREYSAGMAEVVKYAMIADSQFFDWLKQNSQSILDRDRSTVASLIQHCCAIKAQVVEEDTRETTGRRAILNFGHTVGHAIENLSGYGTVLHGEAISIGMVAETKLAAKLGKCCDQLASQLEDLLQVFRLPTEMPELGFDELKVAMQGDKKNTGSKIVFVLPTQIGEVVLCDNAELSPEIFV